MSVRFHGMCSGRSSSHVNAGSMTTHFGTPPALLFGSGSRSSPGAPTLYAKSALLHVITPMIVLGVVRAVSAIAVELPRSHVGQVAVPGLIRPLAQANLVRLDGVVLVVEQAELDRRGAL